MGRSVDGSPADCVRTWGKGAVPPLRRGRPTHIRPPRRRGAAAAALWLDTTPMSALAQPPRACATGPVGRATAARGPAGARAGAHEKRHAVPDPPDAAALSPPLRGDQCGRGTPPGRLSASRYGDACHSLCRHALRAAPHRPVNRLCGNEPAAPTRRRAHVPSTGTGGGVGKC
eukprot:TRINITY_DN6459_c0_g1_i1.p1 TRINITY_DN6459_c0_g1~~TRINITY_DN6459_c0_g1_i1.p1  ORF type:complete len:173 (-),score=0.33 TRINITY_DN6459_c0_g1_i1:10-528(-)